MCQAAPIAIWIRLFLSCYHGKFSRTRRPLNFAAHGKLDLRPKIIHFYLKLALVVKKVVGFGIKI